MLEITNLTKSYAKSDKKAVDDLTLRLNRGEIFGFLGPNGAGKTTTIKMIMGILTPDGGRITINGIDAGQESMRAKKMLGYVSDSHIIYDKLSGREYVDFLADIYGVDAVTRRIRCDALLERFHLKEAFNDRINTYSHGMKQKISVIGALIHEPELWVLDEPMTGLDPQSSFELKELMRAHCAAGKTVFFSTHVLEVAEKLCDRVGIIVNGRLVLVGTMAEIKAASNDKSLEEVFMSVAGGNRDWLNANG
ncbi:MAG: ABC transporter ATP-binding protein [Clostridiales bacterium]|nr:ABC transporter ATP-binding protein [Clostridiales bacterium]